MPVVPGMEMCHWPFRKTSSKNWPKLLGLLLEGKPVKADQAIDWLLDYAGSMEEALQMAWKIATDGEAVLPRRKLKEDKLKEVSSEISGLSESDDLATIAARKAILESVRNCCDATLSEALALQAKHSAAFMATPHCQNGIVGTEYKKTMIV